MSRISFDLDGVLCDFTRGFTRLAHEMFGTLVCDSFAQRSWFVGAMPDIGLTKEMNDQVWEKIDKSTMFWESLDPLNPSVMERIAHLSDVVFITNRCSGFDFEDQTIRWLRRHGVFRPNVIFTDSRKGRVAKSLGVVAHIDDREVNCSNVRKHLPEAFVSLLSLPHNFDCMWEGHRSLSVDHYLNDLAKKGLL